MACLQGRDDTDLKTCTYGDPATATETVALIGDSHTASLYEAVQHVADERGWTVVVDVKAGCSALGPDRFLGVNRPLDEPPSCRVWGQDLYQRLVDDPTITRVLTSCRSDIYKYRSDDGELVDAIPADVV